MTAMVTKSAAFARARTPCTHAVQATRTTGPRLLGHAVQHVEGRDHTGALRERPEPLLVERHDLGTSVQADQDAIDGEAEARIDPTDHERIRLNGDDRPQPP